VFGFGAGWLNLLAGAVFTGVAVLSLARSALSTGAARLAAAAQALMAAGMVAMLVPALSPLARWPLAAVFGASTVWSLVELVRLGPAYGPRGLALGPAAWQRAAGLAGYHLAANLFMTFAALAGHAGPPAGAHHGSLPSPIGLLLTAGFLLAALCSLAELSARHPAAQPARFTVRALVMAPAVSVGCTVTMATGMAAMALAMS
jgi:Domain of unknown function (DUF5134)